MGADSNERGYRGRSSSRGNAVPQEMVNDIINDVLKLWADEFVKYRREAAQNLGQLTGQGKDSFDGSVLLANTSSVAEALFEFEQYLRYYDMRKLSWSNVANVDAMEGFVKKKGIENFIPKFKEKYGFVPRDKTKLINRIAWGIAISYKQNTTWRAKRKKWYNKGKELSLNILYRRLQDALSAETLAEMKAALETRII